MTWCLLLISNCLIQCIPCFVLFFAACFTFLLYSSHNWLLWAHSTYINHGYCVKCFTELNCCNSPCYVPNLSTCLCHRLAPSALPSFYSTIHASLLSQWYACMILSPGLHFSTRFLSDWFLSPSYPASGISSSLKATRGRLLVRITWWAQLYTFH